MDSVNTAKEQDSGLVPAEQLREMTTSPEEIKRRTKESLLETFMGDMVKAAEQSGKFEIIANLRPDFDKDLRQEIADELTAVGYVVTTEEKVAQVGPYLELKISWA